MWTRTSASHFVTRLAPRPAIPFVPTSTTPSTMAADSSGLPASPETLSPHFNDEDLNSVRKVKPLPKRRRMIDPVMIPASENAGHGMAQISESELNDAADQLADALSTGMALQSQFGPLFSGVQDLLKGDVSASLTNDTFTFRFGENDMHDVLDHGDGGEYIDHLQQPENKKKRKIPGVSRLGDDRLGAEDDLADALLFSQGRNDILDSLTGLRLESPALDASTRKPKLSRAAKVALQHKELLKSRKRQLAAVLGALSLGDPLALDQALTSSYPLAKGGRGQKSKCPPIRLSRRPTRRKARAVLLSMRGLEGKPFIVPTPSENSKFPFTFECDCATSERLRATKEEVAYLHDRFEAELSRQAAKATEVAKEASVLANKAKQHERSQRSTRSNAGAGQKMTETVPMNDVDKNAVIPPTKSKKKKRSALANASNPHHLRNYVPSRLPNSGSLQSNINAHNTLGAFPLRFLSADLPPRRGKNPSAARRSNIANPAEEWICSLCEYKLFYGDDEQERRRAVRNRKKILSRRRRALERAAAAASGAKKKPPPPAPVEEPDDEDDLGDELEDALDSLPPDVSSPSRQEKTQQDRDRDKEVFTG